MKAIPAINDPFAIPRVVREIHGRIILEQLFATERVYVEGEESPIPAIEFGREYDRFTIGTPALRDFVIGMESQLSCRATFSRHDENVPIPVSLAAKCYPTGVWRKNRKGIQFHVHRQRRGATPLRTHGPNIALINERDS